MDIVASLKNMPAGQRRAGRALVMFFSMMLAFTLLSRGFSAFTTARVTAVTPSRGTLTHEITLRGAAKLAGGTAFPLPEGFLVEELLIQEGSRIAEGDLIARLDTDYIEQRLETTRRELQDAQLAFASQKAREVTPERDEKDRQYLLEEARMKLVRAREDAASAEKASNQAVAYAESELSRARQERRRILDEDYGDDEDGNQRNDSLTAINNEIAAKARALEEAVLAGEEARLRGQRAIEDAKYGMEETRRGIRETARTDREQAQKDLAEAEAGRLERGRGSLVITEKQNRIAEMEALLAQKGQITAGQGGVVTALNIKAGDVTGGGGAFLLAGSGGCVFKASAGKKEAERLLPGDSAEIVLTGRREPITAAVTGIQAPEEAGGSYTVEVSLPGQSVLADTPGTLRAVQRGSGESQLLPLTALYSDGGENQGYVFVLRERETTMGTQLTAERLDVEVLDRGSRMAAIDGAFLPEDRVITDSSRILRAGDRVRLEEKA